MKKLSFIMAVLMILMCMPIMTISAAETNEEAGYVMSDADNAAVSDGNIAKTGDAYFTTISAAIQAAADGGVVYVLTDISGATRQTWAAEGKDVTIDFLGHKMSGGEAEGKSGRIININAFGTDYMKAGETGTKDVANASEVVVKNAKFEAAIGSVFQLYDYMTLTLDNVEMVCKKTEISSVIICGRAILNVINGSRIETYAYSKASNNSDGAGLRLHSAYGTINMEDSYMYSEGGSIKFASGGCNATIKNCVLETGYQNTFVNAEGTTTLTIEDSEINVYTKGNYESGSDAAFIQMYGNTNIVTVKNTNVNVKNLKSGSYVISNSDQSKKSGVKWTFINTNIAANGNGICVGGDIDLVIDGGYWNVENRLLLCQKDDVADGKEQARVKIYGGTFLVKKNNSSVSDFSGLTPLGGAILASNGKSFEIFDGTFTLFADDGMTLNSNCPVIYSWAGAKDLIQVYGGTFNGGNAFLGRVNYSGDSAAPYDEAGSVLYTHTYGNSTSFAPVAKEGASVRLDKNSSGLRFTSVVSVLQLTILKKTLRWKKQTLAYGTMIVPSDYAKYAGGELTMEAFDKAGKAYLNIEAKDGVMVDENGNVVINAAMVNIKEDNYDRDFIAVAYIKYTDKTGAEVIKYATNVTLAAFSRNVQEVAHAALADVLTTSAGTYTNKVDGYYVWNQNARKYELTPGVAYSRYNAEQLAVLKSYIIAE